MKVLGIVAEYNPFHLGHLYHLKKSQELVQPDYTIAVMSGNFTQRGEAALVDKWVRTETAISNGIDLVLELPVLYAVQTAELFAHGSIETLNQCGLVTHVSFGSEIGDLSPLHRIADILLCENAAFKELLKEGLQQGLSFPSARYRALKDYLMEIEPAMDNSMELKQVLASPNSILGIEYLKALKRTHSSITPVTISRIHAGYSSAKLKKGISSATAIRKEIFQHGLTLRLQEALPHYTFERLSESFNQNAGPVSNQSFEQLLLGLLRHYTTEEIKEWMDVTEGLENRLKESAQTASSLEEFFTATKSKRYVYTRLQRILIHGLLNITKESFWDLHHQGGPCYLRILGFSKNAGPLMKRLKDTAKVPIITKAAHISRYAPNVQDMFSYDCLATDLYSLGLNNPSLRRGKRDFTKGPIIM